MASSSSSLSTRALIRQRLADEQGTWFKDAPEQVALVYPSPYHTGMSSLGFQSIYREINASAGRAAHRAFLPATHEWSAASRSTLLTYERQRPVADYPIIAFSVAYEIEMAGMIQCLELAGIPPLAQDRDARQCRQ